MGLSLIHRGLLEMFTQADTGSPPVPLPLPSRMQLDLQRSGLSQALREYISQTIFACQERRIHLSGFPFPHNTSLKTRQGKSENHPSSTRQSRLLSETLSPSQERKNRGVFYLAISQD